MLETVLVNVKSVVITSSSLPIPIDFKARKRPDVHELTAAQYNFFLNNFKKLVSNFLTAGPVVNHPESRIFSTFLISFFLIFAS